MSYKIYNFSLGCRTSMVHQNTTHPSIPYPYIPIGDGPRVMNPHTYHILPTRTQTLHFGQHVIFSCPKVAFRKRLPQHQKKGIGSKFEHIDTFHICICHIGGVMGWGTIEYFWPYGQKYTSFCCKNNI
jgi:hypothetical protein